MEESLFGRSKKGDYDTVIVIQIPQPAHLLTIHLV